MEAMGENELGRALERTGFVAVVGRPSSGKSTLLNTLIGYKVSIVSAIPQTTRDCVRAIYNDASSQIIFLDTPGIHQSIREYNQDLSGRAFEAVKNADLILCLHDLSRALGEEDRKIFTWLNERAERTLVFANKSDLVKEEELGRRIEEIKSLIKPRWLGVGSALKREDLLTLVEKLKEYLEPGPQLYPTDYYTDQAQDYRVAEIIREKIFLKTREEIPHASCVLVDRLDFDQEKERIRIEATIYLEAASQKGMVIGAKGAMIKEIGTLARKEIAEVFGYPTDLFLNVAVKPGWRKDQRFLSLLGKQYQRN